jgi:hypothetical protein
MMLLLHMPGCVDDAIGSTDFQELVLFVFV